MTAFMLRGTTVPSARRLDGRKVRTVAKRVVRDMMHDFDTGHHGPDARRIDQHLLGVHPRRSLLDLSRCYAGNRCGSDGVLRSGTMEDVKQLLAKRPRKAPAFVMALNRRLRRKRILGVQFTMDGESSGSRPLWDMIVIVPAFSSEPSA